MNKVQAEKEAREWNKNNGIYAYAVKASNDPEDDRWDVKIEYLASKFDDDVAHESFRGWR